MIANEIIEGVDFTSEKLQSEYEGCEFLNCHFSTTDLSNITFIECKFDQCDLSNATLKQTAFKDVGFENCKLLGLQFDDCNKFLLEMSFSNCQLDFSSFYGLKLKGTRFKSCKLQEVDFSKLAGAIFYRTMLEKADFRGASDYTIDPEENKIKRARFSNPDVIGLLSKYDIQID